MPDPGSVIRPIALAVAASGETPPADTSVERDGSDRPARGQTSTGPATSPSISATRKASSNDWTRFSLGSHTDS